MRLSGNKSLLEELFYEHVRKDLPLPKRQFQAVPGRKWSWDFAWPDHMVLVEIQGGTHSQGRHVRPEGYEGDCRKGNNATLLGYRCYSFTGQMVTKGEALEFITKVLMQS